MQRERGQLERLKPRKKISKTGLSWMKDHGFQLLTEGIAADVIKDSAMEEGSDNELQETTIKKKLLSSARDGTDAIINYVDSSPNSKLQEYHEHLRTVSEILQQTSAQTKLDSFLKPAFYSKTSTTSESAIDE
jgi:hypothetical protein